MKVKVEIADGDKLEDVFIKFFSEKRSQIHYKKQPIAFGKMRQHFYLQYFGIDYSKSEEYTNRFVFYIEDDKKFLLTRMKYDF